MFCVFCGKSNTKQSKFCQNCGGKLLRTTKIIKSPKSNEIVTSDTEPYPYIVPIKKLIFLSVATLGAYQFFWFYKQFKSMKAETNWKINPVIRSLFSPYVAFSLFKRISTLISSLPESEKLRYAFLAISIFCFSLLGYLPKYYDLLSLFSFLPLISVQTAITTYWKAKYGDRVVSSPLSKKNIIFSVIIFPLLLLLYVGIYALSENISQDTNREIKTSQTILASSSEDSLLQAINKKRVSKKVNELTKNAWVCEVAKIRLEDIRTLGTDTFDNTAGLQRAMDTSRENIDSTYVVDIEPLYYMETYTYQETIEDSIEQWDNPDNDLYTNSDYEYGCAAIGNGYGVVITGYGDIEKERAEYNTKTKDKTPLMKI